MGTFEKDLKLNETSWFTTPHAVVLASGSKFGIEVDGEFVRAKPGDIILLPSYKADTIVNVEFDSFMKNPYLNGNAKLVSGGPTKTINLCRMYYKDYYFKIDPSTEETIADFHTYILESPEINAILDKNLYLE